MNTTANLTNHDSQDISESLYPVSDSISCHGPQPEKLGPIFYINALETVDKKFLRYDYAKSKVQNKYQAATDTFLKALKNKTKEQLPRIDLQAGTIQGVFADFDSLEAISALVPASFANSWTGIRRWLSCKFSNGCVFPSASGKAKIFFPFTEANLTAAKAKNRARQLVGDEYNKVIDGNGIRFSFIDENGYAIISKWLKSMDYSIAVASNNSYLNREESRDILVTSQVPYKWDIYLGTIPENAICLLRKQTKNSHLESVIRYALGSSSCVSTGVAIPQVLAETTLGIPHRAVSRALQMLTKLGVLKVVAPSQYRLKATKYVFCGEWASIAQEILKTNCRPLGGSLKGILESFEDGNWNDNLFKLTNYFSNEADYIDAVSKIPGFEDKADRLPKAVSAWKSHITRDINKKVKEI